jgi:hypothetical protein
MNKLASVINDVEDNWRYMKLYSTRICCTTR